MFITGLLCAVGRGGVRNRGYRTASATPHGRPIMPGRRPDERSGDRGESDGSRLGAWGRDRLAQAAGAILPEMARGGQMVRTGPPSREEFPMIFAAPIVGRILASCAASQAAASVLPGDGATSAIPAIDGRGGVNAAAFAQTLDNVQAPAPKPPHADIVTL